jgi:hypothetical protein
MGVEVDIKLVIKIDIERGSIWAIECPMCDCRFSIDCFLWAINHGLAGVFSRPRIGLDVCADVPRITVAV